DDKLYFDLIPIQRGGKPGIYLFSPHVVDASVGLTLTREWNLSVIYPVVPAKRAPNGRETIQWDTRTHPDGSLTECTTSPDVAYLFWEALTNHTTPISPPDSPVLGQSAHASFSPTTCDLSPADSILLAVTEVTPYLDAAVHARPTYRDPHVVLASITAETRICRAAVRSLGGVRNGCAAGYYARARRDHARVHGLKGCHARTSRGVETECRRGGPARWRALVGVDVERALDPALFRVLEWGGMEVL
ncbi:hypothetical protein C8R44DRAFT_919708, partial [Mycena epipterygia]